VSLTVSFGSLLSFLDDHVDRLAPEPTTETTGICLVAGGIVGSNLEAELRRQGIPTERLAISTIEDTTRTLLESHHRRAGVDDPSVELLDTQLCQTLLVDTITSAPESAGLETVDELLGGFEWTDRPALRETLWNELDRYFRMTDAGRDHDAARTVAHDLAEDDPYAAERSRRALDAFDELHTALINRTDPLAETAYLSRSHLVSAARQQLDSEWTRCFPDVEWVALDSVAVLDNPTLRLFETLGSLDSGPDIYVFGTESGAGPRLYDRLAATSLDPQLADSESVDAPHVDALMRTADGDAPDSIPNTEFIDAPDGRRELAAVATRIRELTGLADGSEATTTCGEIVVAAKDVIPYRHRIEAVFRAHGLPTHIQARRPLMQTVPYRYLTAVCKLLAAAETDQPVTVHELVDPLRLGYCPPDLATSPEPAATVEWPLDGAQVAELETWLETLVDETTAEDGQPFAAWAKTIRASCEPHEQPAAYTLTEWIESTELSTPDSETAVVDRLTGLLDAHAAPLASQSVRRASGPGIDDTRTALTATHDTAVVDRLRRELDRVGSYLEQAVETNVASYCWQEITAAVRQVCGGASYWPRAVDGNAVRVVNAANAHYLDAEYAFVIGLGAEEFPADRSPPTLFHESFYTAIQDGSTASTDSARRYLHAPTADSQFEGDIEEYHAAVSAADQGVWLCRQYASREGEPVPWSGFVDAYTSTADADADDIHRIAVDEWLPRGDDQQTAVRTATPRDRLGLLCGTFPDGLAGTTRPQQSTAGLSDREAILELLSAADGEAYRQEIEPRRRRYAGDDIRSVTVEPDEPAQQDVDGTATRSTEAVAGPPIRTHELDLYANCQLKYYFRQYVAGGRSRDEPRAATDAEIPRLLSERYPTPAFRTGLRRLITTVLADRQPAFDRFESVTAFRDQLATWIADDPALDDQLMQPMIGEYQAVQQELDAGIAREWRWQPAQTVRIDGHELQLPAHRVDSLADHTLAVPVFYTGGPGAAARVVACSLAERSPVTERDHRLLAGAAAVETFGGALVYDPTSSAPPAPHGIAVGDLNPIPKLVVDSSNLTQHSRPQWTDRYELWTDSAASALDAMTATGDPLTYRSSESFVESGGCAGCLYRELCGVPASHGRDR